MSFKVIVNESSGDDFGDALGLSEERKIELGALIDEFIEDKDGPVDTSKLISEVSEMCTNINEVAYVAFVLGYNSGENNGILSLLTRSAVRE